MSDVFSDLHDACAALGTKLFTVSAYDPAKHLFRRVYTSHPSDYPTSGTKPVVEDDWTRLVLGEGRSFVANTSAGFAPFFPDHEQITALGCYSAMNIPLIGPDHLVVGTVNLLSEVNHFTSERAAAYEALVQTHKPALLAALAGMPLA